MPKNELLRVHAQHYMQIRLLTTRGTSYQRELAMMSERHLHDDGNENDDDEKNY